MLIKPQIQPWKYLRLVIRKLMHGLLAFVFICTTSFADSEINLPVLGDSSAGLLTPAEEFALGQAWLRSFRASVPLETDPLLFEYMENLLLKLASSSELENRRLDLVMVKNPTINAFAVPGGVVGVHTGLVLNAETEAQLASVLAHELAHLSQRHFARSVEAAKRANLTSIAGLLAGIILAATAGGDAATAAIATSQAAAIDSQLRYSRLHEREADRLGFKTLKASQYDPTSAANMFKQMQNISRLYGQRIPEFLLTHPITESRIADAENRARQAETGGIRNTIDYQLIRARVFTNSQTRAKDAIKHFKFLLDKTVSLEKTPINSFSTKKANIKSLDASRYGLALAYNEDGQWRKARKTLTPLLNQMPGRIPYSILDIEIDIEAGKLKQAETRLRDLYSLIPNNYAISMLLAQTLIKNKRYSDSTHVLKELTNVRPKQSDIWYLLAEAQGLEGDILGLHQSRAEFFVLRGNFQQAAYHLNYALKISGDNFQSSARIKQRAKEIRNLQQLSKKL